MKPTRAKNGALSIAQTSPMYDRTATNFNTARDRADFQCADGVHMPTLWPVRTSLD
jgi:hypothetical protein